MSEYILKLKEGIIAGDHKEIEKLAQIAVDNGIDPGDLINNGMVEAMEIVGQKYSANEIFVPEMLVSAVTMQKAMNIVKPLLKDGSVSSKGKVIICTVKGDIHDIGKNLVTMMLDGAGFEVIDLGVDLSVEKVIDAVQEHKPDILGLSALLTTTMQEMEMVINALKEHNLRDKVKIMIGGAPVDKEYAIKVGADGYAADAGEAVTMFKELLNAT
ncbi:MAG: corrinoid protein [Desulfobacteraceae bacterium]|nr:corrinoid protein [Desulfobacteraceae bacterium]